MFQQRYRMFAAYNAWANGRLMDACEALDEAGWAADRGSAFGSLRGTLNHLLVADRIWMRRLTGEGESYDRLDLVPHPDRLGFRAAREGEDARIARYVDGLDAERLAAPLEYANMSGTRIVQPLCTALDHLFNHQTHHRGQAHALVSMAGGTAPALDLVYFQREAGISAAD